MGELPMSMRICSACKSSVIDVMHPIAANGQMLCGRSGRYAVALVDEQPILDALVIIDRLVEHLDHHFSHEDVPVEMHGTNGWRDVQPDVELVQTILRGESP